MNKINGLDLLLVEDNPQDLELTLRALQKGQLEDHTQVARDGVEALEYIFCEGAHAERSQADNPRLVLLDLKLPKLDGLQVLKRIKGDPRTRHIPVVVLTSSKEQRDLEESLQLGVNSYIVKPVNIERFAEAMRDLALYWLLLYHEPKGDG